MADAFGALAVLQLSMQADALFFCQIFFFHFQLSRQVEKSHLLFLFGDHLIEKREMVLLDMAGQLKVKQEDFAKKQGIRLHGELKDRKGSEGICHSVIAETYALPGQLNVGSDSHTPHVGAVGCVAFGIGTTDVFNSWITKDVRVK